MSFPDLSKIRLLIFDVDGVLTEGKVGDSGRRWNVKDGFGFYLAWQAGLRLALCSGKGGEDVQSRAKLLHLDSIKTDRMDKAVAVTEILAETGCDSGEALFVGDDLFDLPAMAQVAISVAPSDARPEVCRRVDWVAESAGGAGVAREVIDAVLKARGDWDRVCAPFLGEE